MATNWYAYYQVNPKSDWKLMLSQQKQDVIGLEKPLLVTVLEVDTCITEDTPHDLILKARHRGDMYLDWDCKSPEEFGFCINDVNEFLNKLQADYGVKLESLRIYATGGRGFHVEIPWAIYRADSWEKGAVMLPQTYREMARQMHGRYMDLAIYSAKRGRMWRQPNVQRENGRYKVPITLDEMRRMTVEMYAEICNAPRPEPERAEPELAAKLVALFDVCHSRVLNTRKAVKDRDRDSKILKSYNGIPPTLQKLFDGEGINPDTGLNHFAMQLAIAAQDLGVRDPNDYLEMIDGFIKARAQMPGDKHQTERDIRNEMLRIYTYVIDNDCYAYSIQAIRSCLADGNPSKSRDLDGVRPKVDEEGNVVEEGSKFDEIATAQLQMGLVPTDMFLGLSTDNGLKAICDTTLPEQYLSEVYDPLNPDLPTNFIIVKPQVRGTLHRDQVVERDVFGSPQKLQSLFNSVGGSMPGLMSGPLTQALFNLLMTQLEKVSKVRKKYKIDTEGMQLIQSPEDPNRMDMFWMTPSGPFMIAPDAPDYVYMGFTGREGITGSNVTDAPDLEKMSGGRDVIEALLNFNGSDATVATVIGWMSALFIRPIMLKVVNQFPLLSIVGQAGSGKTTGALTVLQLFSYRRTPELQSVQDSTDYAQNQFLYGSKTVPLALDEAKEKSTKGDKGKWLSQVLHTAYTPGQKVRRGGGNASNKSVMAVSTQEVNAPVLFIAEVLNSVTAIQERCVIAQFSKAGLYGREGFYTTLTEHADTVAAVGKAMIVFTCNQDVNEVIEVYKDTRKLVRDKLFNQQNARVTSNIAAVYTGLILFRAFVRTLYNGDFDTRFEALFDSLLDPMNHPNLAVLSEATKTMALLSFMSHQSSAFDYSLKLGEDYDVLPDGFVDLVLQNAFVKLQKFCKATDTELPYVSGEQFSHGLRNYSACLDPKPSSQVGGPKAKVYRFSAEILDKEGIEPFKQ